MFKSACPKKITIIIKEKKEQKIVLVWFGLVWLVGWLDIFVAVVLLFFFFFFWENSQNHRMVKVGMNFSGSHCSTPPQAGAPTAGCPRLRPGGF